MKLDDLAFHADCSDIYCKQCRIANSVLDSVMTHALWLRHDWLGKYHGWLSKQGIPPETDGGWWTREALSDSNAQRFIEQYGD